MSDSNAASIVKALKKEGMLDVSILSDSDSPCVVNEFLSTGCVALDAILGGGLPVGRVTEFYGDASTGKSLIAAQVVALAQQEGNLATYIDTESAVSIDMMREVGVDVDSLIYASPDTIEEVFTTFEKVVELKKKLKDDSVLLIVWDSIAATSIQQEIQNDYGKATMGRHAQLISQGLRKFNHVISKNRICLLLVNQTREKIGVMFGDNTATFGGKAVSFYSSVRVDLNLGAKLKGVSAKGKGRIIGINTIATCTKNKVAMPFRKCTLPIYFGSGIDDVKASLAFLVENGLVEGTGRGYTLQLAGKDHKFSKASFPAFYDKHYEDVAEVILNYDQDTDVTEEVAE